MTLSAALVAFAFLLGAALLVFAGGAMAADSWRAWMASEEPSITCAIMFLVSVFVTMIGLAVLTGTSF